MTQKPGPVWCCDQTTYGVLFGAHMCFYSHLAFSVKNASFHDKKRSGEREANDGEKGKKMQN